MLSPLKADEQLDVDAIPGLVDFLIDGGVDALFVLGSAGEGATLRPIVRYALVDAVIAANRGRVPVVAGALEPATARVIDDLHSLRGRGLDAYVVTTPYYFTGSSDDELHGHFARVADAADAQVILYNLPSVTNTMITADLAFRLAGHGNIGGVKDSSSDWPLVQTLIRDRPTPDFVVLQGDQERCVESLLLGADGLVPGYANVHPRLFRSMFDAIAQGDESQAHELQAQLDVFLRLRGSATIHANKVLMEALGLAGAR